ncbi:coiled-coil domain-containing protein 130 homolog [Trichoplusia ni]|uniref:Coiled-coil domain-containing protein 130 homolog n=1 Tax=Trichoplusia ni TaxID=7111 RepID=A0A7E5W816_TRINI|nr:coiled-coil domain-containing protein 130 homolog [Trichoplusia ni]
MGERKGQNLYYPPDYDPKVGGLNKFMGTHALRERARKLHMGILIIRFEMPYNIWCDGCKNHIGMGVRYNAEKTKIGMYYTTPVYQFRMKCHLCDNHFEIKTDPGNLDYVIVSGARRQENRWDPAENGQIVADTTETQKKLFDDAMFKLEHKTGDEDAAKLDKPRLGRLVGRNESVWKDDYDANCSLRRKFRKRRKELEEASVNDSLLLAKSSLDISLLPENEDDRNMASLLSLRPSKSIEESQSHVRSKILNTPALPSSSGLLTSFGGLKKEESLAKSSSLTRHALGITIIKKKKIEKEVANDDHLSKEIHVTDNGKLGKEIESKDLGVKEENAMAARDVVKGNDDVNTGNDCKVDDKDIKGNNVDDKKEEIETKDKKISLVCDYSSSGESSEG